MPPVLEEVSVDSNIISTAITATVEVVKEKLGLVDNQDALQSSLGSQGVQAYLHRSLVQKLCKLSISAYCQVD